jgi:hypothetical protein
VSYFINFNRLALSLIPISLIFSIFVTDLLITILSLNLIAFTILKKKIDIFNTKEFKIFLIFYAVCLLSSIFSEFSSDIFIKTIGYIRFGLIIVLIQYLIKNDHKFIKYFLFSILFSFFILIIGLFLQLSGFELLFPQTNTSRYSSFFFDELILGSYIIKLLPICIALLLLTNLNKYYYILPSLAVIAIFLSGERTALISFCIFISLLITFTNLLNLKKKIFSFVFVSILFFITLTIFPEVKFRLIDQTMYQLGILEPDEDYKEFLVTEKSIYAKKNGIVVYKDLIDGVSVNVLRNTKEDIEKRIQLKKYIPPVISNYESIKDVDSKIFVLDWKEKTYLYKIDPNLKPIISNLNPRIVIRDLNVDNFKIDLKEKEYQLKPQSTIFFRHGQKISTGEEIAKTPKYTAVVKEEYFIPLKYYLMFKTAYKIFRDNLVFGSGIKTFRKLCKDERYYIKKNYKAFEGKPDNYYKGFTGLDGCSTHPHNYYIQLLSETGLFSFLIIVFCFFYYFFNFFKKNNLSEKIICLSIVVNFFPFLFSGSFFNNFISIMILLPIAFSCLNMKKINKINMDN